MNRIRGHDSSYPKELGVSLRRYLTMPFESVLPDGDSFIVSEAWAGLGDVGRRRL